MSLMVHKRSKAAKKRRLDERTRRQKELEDSRSIVLRYSWRDREDVIGELVFTEQNIEIIESKLKTQFGCVPNHAVDHDFGEVLNRFRLRAPPVYSYVSGKFRGAFQ